MKPGNDIRSLLLGGKTLQEALAESGKQLEHIATVSARRVIRARALLGGMITCNLYPNSTPDC